MAVFAEPLAAAYAVLRDLSAAIGERLILFGDGRLGQLIARVTFDAGYEVLVVGRHPAKLQLCRDLGMATHQLHADLTLPGEFDIAVDATGDVRALPLILGCLRPRGTLILKSTSARQADLDLAPLVVNELRVIGSRCGPFPPAITALAQGIIDPRPLISDCYPLSAGVQAMARAAAAGVLKVLLTAG